MEKDEFNFELEEVDVPDVDVASDILDYEDFGLEPVETRQEQDQPQVWDANYLPKNIVTVRESMKALRGPIVDDWDDQEAIDNYLETFRSFESGNSLTTIRMFQSMMNSDEETLRNIGKGIELYDNMGSAFGEGATWADTRQAVGDYASAVVLDPVNLLGLGLGKLFTGAGTKVAATGARVAAAKALKQGASVEVAEKVFKQAITTAGKETVEGIAKRTAQTQATKGFRRLATKEFLKEAGVVLGTDAAVAAGIEAMYQGVRTETGVQENFGYDRVAMMALGTMLLGGVVMGTTMAKGGSGFTPSVRFVNEEADAGAVLRAIVDTVEEGDWAGKVARGTELKDLDGEFWIDLVNNMLPTMEREGYVWARRSDDDKVSNWLADIIKSAEPEDARLFAKEWSEKSGIPLPSLDEKGLDFFADTFAFKMNQSARMMNKASEVARKLGVDAADVKVKHMLEEELQNGVAAVPYLQGLFANTAAKTSRIQNNVIRLIVSNLSTTRLNLVGYGASSAMNSASDTLQSALYGYMYLGAKAVGKNGDEFLRKAKINASMQRQKVANLLDPNTTYDQFLAYQQMRPQQLRELTTVLQGGIEDPAQIAKYMGIDPNMTVLGAKSEAVIEAIQKFNFVQAQDVYTKSQEFLYQLDKKLRYAFDRPLQELLQSADMRQLMADPKWIKAEAEAVWETQRAIYSATYRRSGPELGKLAAFIEDFRNIPGLGLTIPFGRFFNNVVATSMDVSGASLAAKLFGYQGNRSFYDLGARAAVSWTYVAHLATFEQEYIDRGLATFEQENEKGEVVDVKYTYPLSLFKGLARLTAYRQRGEEPPQGLMEELAQLIPPYQILMGQGEVPPNVAPEIAKYAVGQLTRDLNTATADTLEIVRKITTGEATADDWVNMFSAPIVAGVSGATRFIEPLNVIKQVIDGRDFSQLDRKDGVQQINDALRYIDQFLSTSDVQRYDAAGGRRTPQVDKYFGDRSNVPTNTERVLNMLGLNPWELDETTPDIEANNVWAKYFHSYLEQQATRLMGSTKFREGDLEVKQLMWGEVKAKAREHTKGYMALKMGRESDYKKVIDIFNKHSLKNIDRAMQEVAPDSDISDLNRSQLQLLENWLDNRDSYLKLRK